MDKKRILLLCAMGILLAAAIALGAVWIMKAAEYAGYKADYVDIAEDVLHSDEDDGMIELVPLSPAPKQNDTLDDPTASAATDPPIYSRAFQACIRLQRGWQGSSATRFGGFCRTGRAKQRYRGLAVYSRHQDQLPCCSSG